MAGSTPVPLLASCRTDPVIIALCTGAVLCAGLIIGGPRPATVSWLVQGVFLAVYALLSWQIAREPGAPPPVRRFWRAATVGGVFFTAGALLQALTTVGKDLPSAAVFSLPAFAFIAAGALRVIWAMLTHPLNTAGRERLRLWLDAATVMCGVAVFTWWVSLTGGTPATMARLVMALIGSGLMLVSAFAMVRMLLSGSAPFTLASGLASGTAAALIGLGAALNGFVSQLPDIRVVLTARLVPPLLLAASARIEQLQTRGRPIDLSRQRRSTRHSRLPYVAVGATQCLLLLELWHGGLTMRAWGTVVGAVVIAALVLIRQNIAFTDNAQLVTKLDRSMLELRRHERRFRSLVQHASDVIMLVNAQGAVVYASPALERVLGLTPEQAVGRPVLDVIQPDDKSTVEPLLAQLTKDPGGSVTTQLQVRHVDGSCRWLELVATNQFDDASVSGVIVNVGDVTQARMLQDRLRHDATHDSLTGLANRALLTERTRPFREDPDRVADSASVLMLDLDDFKEVNDLLGHHVGDQLLVVVAERLRMCVRPTDTVARLGGDEFAVLLAGTSRSNAISTAQRIRTKLSEPVMVDGHLLEAHASVGIAVGLGRQFDALLRDADAAMYEAKRSKSGTHVSESREAQVER